MYPLFQFPHLNTDCPKNPNQLHTPNRINPMPLLLLLATLAGCSTIRPTTAPPQIQGAFDHTLLDRVLTRFVDQRGRVDYTALQQDPDDLERYYAQVAAYSPDSHPALFSDQASQLTYWINAYNGATLKNVLTHYPIAGVADVKAPKILFFLPEKSAFFYLQRLLFGDKAINLYNLEHDIIRKRFAEPRIHFALNCASVGCPRLPQKAFSAANLEAELERETRYFLSEERNFRLDHAQKAIYLSELFSWYEEDFLTWYKQLHPDQPASILAYIRLYLPPAQKAALAQGADYQIRYTPYDWSLNDQRAAPD